MKVISVALQRGRSLRPRVLDEALGVEEFVPGLRSRVSILVVELRLSPPQRCTRYRLDALPETVEVSLHRCDHVLKHQVARDGRASDEADEECNSRYYHDCHDEVIHCSSPLKLIVDRNILLYSYQTKFLVCVGQPSHVHSRGLVAQRATTNSGP